MSTTGAAIWSKANFGPTGHHHPRSSPFLGVCIVLGVFTTFSMHPGSCIPWGCLAPPAILPRSPQLCQNAGLPITSLFREIGKSSVDGGRQSCCSFDKHSLWKMKREAMSSRDSKASSFFAKVRGEVFAHFLVVVVKRRISVWNWLLGLPGRILCEQSPWYKRNLSSWSWLWSSTVSHFFFLSRRVWTFRVRLMLSSPNACLNITSVFVALFFRDLHKIWCRSFVGSIAKSHQARYIIPNKKTQEAIAFTQQREILYTGSQDRVYHLLFIAQLQLSYRWQHVSRKLWIPPHIYREKQS
jgi:hypothetical protein